jgi:lipopolysaccharide export system protein LptA
VELTDGGEAERLTCVGDARLDDRAAGNSARGERAVYDLATRTVTMTGDPVTLRKSDGAQVQGGRVVYDLDTGKARVVGEGGAS